MQPRVLAIPLVPALCEPSEKPVPSLDLVGSYVQIVWFLWITVWEMFQPERSLESTKRLHLFYEGRNRPRQGTWLDQSFTTCSSQSCNWHPLLQPCQACAYLPPSPSRYTLYCPLSDMNRLCSLASYCYQQYWDPWPSAWIVTCSRPPPLPDSTLQWPLSLFMGLGMVRALLLLIPGYSAVPGIPQLPVYPFVNGLSVHTPTLNYPNGGVLFVPIGTQTDSLALPPLCLLRYLLSLQVSVFSQPCGLLPVFLKYYIRKTFSDYSI